MTVNQLFTECQLQYFKEQRDNQLEMVDLQHNASVDNCNFTALKLQFYYFELPLTL